MAAAPASAGPDDLRGLYDDSEELLREFVSDGAFNELKNALRDEFAVRLASLALLSLLRGRWGRWRRTRTSLSRSRSLLPQAFLAEAAEAAVESSEDVRAGDFGQPQPATAKLAILIKRICVNQECAAGIGRAACARAQAPACSPEPLQSGSLAHQEGGDAEGVAAGLGALDRRPQRNPTAAVSALGQRLGATATQAPRGAGASTAACEGLSAACGR